MRILAEIGGIAKHSGVFIVSTRAQRHRFGYRLPPNNAAQPTLPPVATSKAVAKFVRIWTGRHLRSPPPKRHRFGYRLPPNNAARPTLPPGHQQGCSQIRENLDRTAPPVATSKASPLWLPATAKLCCPTGASSGRHEHGCSQIRENLDRTAPPGGTSKASPLWLPATAKQRCPTDASSGPPAWL